MTPSPAHFIATTLASPCAPQLPCTSAVLLQRCLILHSTECPLRYPHDLVLVEESLVTPDLSTKFGLFLRFKRLSDHEIGSHDSLSSLIILQASFSPLPLASSASHDMQSLNISTSRALLSRENLCDPAQSFFELCPHITRERCRDRSPIDSACSKVHFVPLITPNTDPSLGDCSYLNTCHRMPICKFLHYEIEDPGPATSSKSNPKSSPTPHSFNVVNGLPLKSRHHEQYPPQWLQCDVRQIDFDVLGKFDVIVADPPWDIHMTLPYGTMTDEEMLNMPVGKLQNDGGLLFLWVTVRTQDLGRQCLHRWGYERIDELLWIKTSQLPKLIRTGRTGHWLNHGKEHCMVACKRPPTLPSSPSTTTSTPTTATQPTITTSPSPSNHLAKAALSAKSFNDIVSQINRGIDTDVIVSEVQETSRKPIELYEMIERLCPFGRKLEIFGRLHNTRHGWLTLGNQLKSTKIWDPNLLESWNDRYPQNYASLATK